MRVSRRILLIEMIDSLLAVKLYPQFNSSTNWKEDISHTKFNLAPRGYGRTSYRLAEIIQIGRLPVYMYNDFSWLPYADSPAGVPFFGLVGRRFQMYELANAMAQLSDAAVSKRLAHVSKIREFYTYAGVLIQLEKFFEDPLAGSAGSVQPSRELGADVDIRSSNFLRCSRVPDDPLGHNSLGKRVAAKVRVFAFVFFVLRYWRQLWGGLLHSL